MTDLRMTRGNGRVAEKAKAHGALRLRMVAGRADRTKRIFDRTGHHLIHRLHPGTCRQQCGVRRAG